MAEWLPVLVSLLATGAVAGLLAGLLGVGGGIVIVPVLYFIFQALGISAATAMSVAAATSLLTIIPTSVSSIRAHHKRGNVDYQVVRQWWWFIVLGVVLGAAFSTRAGGQTAALIFGVVAVLIALKMLFYTKNTALLRTMPRKIWQFFAGWLIGFISVIMGIGGGTLGVTILTAFNVSAHRAVATSAVFGFVISLPGALLLLLFAETPSDAPVGTYGLVNLLGFAAIVPLTVTMAPVGVWLGTKLDDGKLKQAFAVFLCLSGLRMIYQALPMSV